MPHISLIQAGQGNLSRKGVKMDDPYIEEGIESNSESFESDLESETISEDIENESVEEESAAPGESIDSPSASDSEEILDENGDIEEGIEEGEEIPDEVEPLEIVQNDEVSGAEQVRSETPAIDYSVQLAQIYEELQTIEGNINFDDINENLISIDSNMELVHRDLVALDRNNKFHSRLEIGLLVAIWGSLIIYIAFSKIF